VAVHPALDVRSESSRCTVKNDPKRSVGPAKSRRSKSRSQEQNRVMGIEPTRSLRDPVFNQSLASDATVACDFRVISATGPY
jgi:hypothetical protein